MHEVVGGIVNKTVWANIQNAWYNCLKPVFFFFLITISYFIKYLFYLNWKVADILKFTWYGYNLEIPLKRVMGLIPKEHTTFA